MIGKTGFFTLDIFPSGGIIKKMEVERNMPLEWEIKLTGNITAALHDPQLALHWQEMSMKTVYYDTAERLLSGRKLTLRLRSEGDRSVVCLKAPHPEAHARCEWQLEAERPDDDTLAALTALGAPDGLPRADLLAPLCGAEFTRRFALLQFPDGSTAEVAHDTGILTGGGRILPFEELELELKAGAPEPLTVLAARLCKDYGLHEEANSKFARARALANG